MTLRPHLVCNLVSQCVGGEDEEGCGYTRCAPGGFVVNGTCYVLQDTVGNRIKTYMQAKVACSSMPRGRLALLKTKQLVRNVQNFFRKTIMQPVDMMVGLSAMGLPYM